MQLYPLKWKMGFGGEKNMIKNIVVPVNGQFKTRPTVRSAAFVGPVATKFSWSGPTSLDRKTEDRTEYEGTPHYLEKYIAINDVGNSVLGLVRPHRSLFDPVRGIFSVLGPVLLFKTRPDRIHHLLHR